MVRIWWKKVGDGSGSMKTNYMAMHLDWDQMIADAEIILTQARMLLTKQQR